MEMAKIKVVLADDENIILDGLCKILTEVNDIAIVCGVANDGEALEELVREKHPDLIITDICMPKASGLDAIKLFQLMNPKPTTVVISGYRDFEYAQKAMEYGVSEYLLKPVDPQKLIALIRRLHREILKQKGVDLLEFASPQASSFQNSDLCYQVAVAKCNTIPDLYKLETCINSTISDNCYFFRRNAHLCILFALPAGTKHNDSVLKYIEYLCQHSGVDAHYAIGDIFSGLTGISQSYSSACNTLELAFFMDEATIFSSMDQSTFCPLPEDNITACAEELCSDIYNGNHFDISHTLDNLTQMILRASGGVKDIAVMHFYSVTDKIYHMITDSELKKNYSPGMTLSFIKECQKATQIKDFLHTMISDLIEQNATTQKRQFDFEIQFVIDYINSHLNENITVESLANLIHKNPYYFSSLFKKATNENCKNYVMRMKMEYAKSELEKTDKRIHQISESVGFIDPHHFSRVFKNHFGFTPSSVRKKK